MQERRAPLLLIIPIGLAATFLSGHLLSGYLGEGASSTGSSLASVAALCSVENPKSIIHNDYGRLPLSFEANQGQTDARVRFLARGGGYTIFLTNDEAVLALRKSQSGTPGRQPSPAEDRKSLRRLLIPDLSQLVPGLNTGKGGVMAGLESQTLHVVRMRFVGGNLRGRIVGLDELPGRSNYFIGNDAKKWRTNVRNYSKVKYQNVYPGIDLVYYGNQRQLEYDLVVAPGADANHIKLSFTGANGMCVDAASGDLVLKVGDDEVRFHKPSVYQPAVARSLMPGGWEPNAVPKFRASSGRPNREPRASNSEPFFGRFVLASNNQVAFRVRGYDPKRALVIDPSLSYSTYLGGSGYESGQAIAVDGAGSAYVTGDTASSDFPTANPLQPSLGSGTSNAFVAKLNAAGSALVYSTYLGGSAGNWGTGISVDSSGNAYVTGNTTSTDFPTVKALQAVNKGTPTARYTAFVAKLNPAGTALVYSTYLGGSLENWSYGIAVDSSGNAYLTGSTLSTDFPTMVPLQAINKATPKAETVTAFVAKLNSTGSALVYSTYLGGSDGESGQGIVVDSSGNAYVTGYTSSTDFPTVNPLQASDRGDFDAFVAKLNGAGSALVYSTYLGGSAVDYGYGIAVDSYGNAYVTGRTYSTDFPTANALQASYKGELDAFVAKLNPAGSALVYSTYLGGDRYDEGNSIAVDPSGNAYVTGVTYSTNFPTAAPVQSTCGGCSTYADAFVAKLNALGSALVYSIYLGGGSVDYGYGIAVDSSGNAYVTGGTASTDFPVAHPLQPSAHGNFDVFVTKISPVGARPFFEQKATRSSNYKAECGPQFFSDDVIGLDPTTCASLYGVGTGFFGLPTITSPVNGNAVLPTPGNLGRNAFTGPGWSNLDFSLIKDTSITESKTLQFRAEFFNLFNFATFGGPNTTLGSPGFGVTGGTATAERQIQLGLRFMF